MRKASFVVIGFMFCVLVPALVENQRTNTIQEPQADHAPQADVAVSLNENRLR